MDIVQNIICKKYAIKQKKLTTFPTLISLLVANVGFRQAPDLSLILSEMKRSL